MTLSIALPGQHLVQLQLEKSPTELLQESAICLVAVRSLNKFVLEVQLLVVIQNKVKVRNLSWLRHDQPGLANVLGLLGGILDAPKDPGANEPDRDQTTTRVQNGGVDIAQRLNGQGTNMDL